MAWGTVVLDILIALPDKFAAKHIAEEFSLEDTTWVYLDELMNKVPIETNNTEQYLHMHKKIELLDSTGIYLVRIKKYKIKNSVSPLKLEIKRIKNIILNPFYPSFNLYHPFPPFLFIS